jgi:hypothetical protein
MDNFAAIVGQQLRVLVGMLGQVSVTDAAAAVTALPDDEVVTVIASSSSAIRELDALRVVATGVAAQRSTRDAGHGGLAQKRGHRSAVALIQDLTGTTRTQAGKAARLGQALLEAPPPPGPITDGDPDANGDAGSSRSAPPVWHRCLGKAFTDGRISLDQQTAIRRGLGDPPITCTPNDATGGEGSADISAADASEAPDDAGAGAGAGSDASVVADAETTAAWAAAAEQLIDEASRRSVEDLGAAARAIRDHLDPDGAARRFRERFERRSFRVWTDRDGVRHASFTFEDHGAAWVTSVIDAALRPRRGGPRFVDPDEKAAAEALTTDPRSNEQLAYDLVIDILHTGALADAETVFGTRQAGLRVIVTDRTTTRNGAPAVAVIEDTNSTVPAAFATQHTCDTGTLTCTTDTHGNPLDLGREARLFSAKQRIALAQRDGGCAWTGCDRPPVYCEAHHIDPYSAGGRTDIDRGILLCRFHHMNLHHHGWHISRDRTGPFILNSPDPAAEPTVLQPRLERRYAFGDLQPPPVRFRPAA